MADLKAIDEKYGDKKIKNKGDRHRKAMQAWAEDQNKVEKEAKRKAELRRGGKVEAVCSFCGKEEIPAFRDGDLCACPACMGKALFGALGEPKFLSELPPEAVAKKEPAATPSDWDEDPEEANEPLVTKAVS